MPKGALLIVNVEFWERFGFYGMLSILVLFLTAATSSGGFGWDKPAALSLVGVYAGLMYSLPLLGGFLADRYLGHRRAITLGATSMTAGHFLLVASVIASHYWGGSGVAATLIQSGVSLGHLSLSSHELQVLSETARLHGVRPDDLIGTHQLVAALFWLAIVALVTGNMLMKSVLVIQLGDQFRADDPKRETAYSFYYLSITFGAFLAGLIVGTAGERIGWQYGFSVAGIGMAIALASYRTFAARFIRERAVRVAPDAPVARDSPSPREILHCFTIVGAAACLLSIFMTGWYQIFGSWILFAQERINRTVLGFEMPIPWFISFNSIVVMICAPLLARLWSAPQLNARLGFPEKMCIALAMGAFAHGVFAVAARLESPSLALPLLGIAVMSMAELVAWVPAYGFVYRVAPARLESAVMGWFYLIALGLSGFFSGLLGRLGAGWGYESLFTYLTSGSLLSGIALLILLPKIRALLGRLKNRLA